MEGQPPPQRSPDSDLFLEDKSTAHWMMEEHSRCLGPDRSEVGELRLGSGSLWLSAHKLSRRAGDWGHNLLEGEHVSVAFIVH